MRFLRNVLDGNWNERVTKLLATILVIMALISGICGQCYRHYTGGMISNPIG